MQQAGLWSAMLDSRAEGWRDAVHTIRGASAGIGAGELAAVCAEAEKIEQPLAPAALDRVRTAMDAAPVVRTVSFVGADDIADIRPAA